MNGVDNKARKSNHDYEQVVQGLVVSGLFDESDLQDPSGSNRSPVNNAQTLMSYNNPLNIVSNIHDVEELNNHPEQVKSQPKDFTRFKEGVKKLLWNKWTFAVGMMGTVIVIIVFVIYNPHIDRLFKRGWFIHHQDFGNQLQGSLAVALITIPAGFFLKKLIWKPYFAHRWERLTHSCGYYAEEKGHDPRPLPTIDNSSKNSPKNQYPILSSPQASDPSFYKFPDTIQQQLLLIEKSFKKEQANLSPYLQAEDIAVLLTFWQESRFFNVESSHTPGNVSQFGSRRTSLEKGSQVTSYSNEELFADQMCLWAKELVPRYQAQNQQLSQQEAEDTAEKDLYVLWGEFSTQCERTGLQKGISPEQRSYESAPNKYGHYSNKSQSIIDLRSLHEYK